MNKEEAMEIFGDLRDVICKATKLERDKVSMTLVSDEDLFPFRVKIDDPVYSVNAVIDSFDSIEPFMNSLILIVIKQNLAELKEMFK